MKTALQQRLGQQLAMTPQLQQAIKLLQLSSTELELEINTALETNPLLEIEELEGYNDYHNESYEPRNEFSLKPLEYTTQRKTYDPPQLKNAEKTLQQHLLWQLDLTSLSERDKAIAMTLIDAISEEGYLLSSLSEIKEILTPEFEIQDIGIIEAVLHRIQQFDPIGVGARNLSECLNIQLDSYDLKAARITIDSIIIAKKIALEHLDLLGKHDYIQLKTKLDLSDSALTLAIKLLKSLDPRPGAQISSKNSEYIVPDIIVWKQNGEWVVELNKEFIPHLRVNPNYAALIQKARTKGDTKMLQEQLKEAKWFLKSLKIRHETLLKVARCIIEQQNLFLEYGEEEMRALNLQDVAKIVDLHESTISRITTQKYVLTPRGVLELKFFFSNSLKSTQGTQSATAIRAKIQKLIAKESEKSPLSDYKIMNILSEQGIHITRRTVAKYREALHIPPSSARKNNYVRV